MRPTGSSTTRLLLTRRTGTSRKTIRSLNLRIVSNLCPTTSRFYLQPMTRQKASRRHRNRTSMANTTALPILCVHVCGKCLRAVLASPLYLQERGASAERSQVYRSERESLMSSSSQDPTTRSTGKLVGTGKPVAVFSSQSRLPIETIFLETSTGFWE